MVGVVGFEPTLSGASDPHFDLAKLHSHLSNAIALESCMQVEGIEPPSLELQSSILPLYYTCKDFWRLRYDSNIHFEGQQPCTLPIMLRRHYIDVYASLVILYHEGVMYKEIFKENQKVLKE